MILLEISYTEGSEQEPHMPDPPPQNRAFADLDNRTAAPATAPLRYSQPPRLPAAQITPLKDNLKGTSAP